MNSHAALFATLYLLFSPSAFALEKCAVKSTDARSTLLTCNKLDVLLLKGSAVERAEAFGERLKNGDLNPALVSYFADRLLGEFDSYPKPLRWLAEKSLNYLAKFFFAKIDPSIAKEFSAIARGMGVRPEYLMRAALLPDFSTYMNALANTWPLRSLPPLGCTSVAKKSSNGDFFYGRNLDFSSGGIWDAHPLIVVHHPSSEQESYKYLAIGSHGVFHGGITGVNETGLSVAIHQNFSIQHGLGFPMLVLGDLILRTSRSIDEAVEFLQKNRPGPTWTFVVTDMKTGQAAAIEADSENLHVRKMEGDAFVQTNHLAGEVFKGKEFLRPALLANSKFRFERATRLLSSDPATQFDLAGILKPLITQSSPNGQIGGYSDILKSHTIQTMILKSSVTTDPRDAKIMLSISEAPAATGIFLEFRMGNLLDLTPETLPEFDGWPAIDPKSATRANQIAGARALQLYFDGKNPKAAIEAVSSQTSLGARLFMATASYELGEFDRAIELANLALADPSLKEAPASVKDGLHKPVLLSLIQLQKSEEARVLADKIVAEGTNDESLLETARLLGQGKGLPLRLRKISYDFFSGSIRTPPTQP